MGSNREFGELKLGHFHTSQAEGEWSFARSMPTEGHLEGRNCRGVAGASWHRSVGSPYQPPRPERPPSLLASLSHRTLHLLVPMTQTTDSYSAAFSQLITFSAASLQAHCGWQTPTSAGYLGGYRKPCIFVRLVSVSCFIHPGEGRARLCSRLTPREAPAPGTVHSKLMSVTLRLPG